MTLEDLDNIIVRVQDNERPLVVSRNWFLLLVLWEQEWQSDPAYLSWQPLPDGRHHLYWEEEAMFDEETREPLTLEGLGV